MQTVGIHGLWLLAGIVVAVYAAKLLVDGSVAISQRLNIPQFVIGAIVIGFGSSMPEFAVNIGAAMKGDTALALGNILGSNLFNIAVTLGIVGLICPLPVGQDTVVKDLPMHVIAALMIGVCGNQLYLDKIEYHQLMVSHGIILLCFFGIYLYYTMLEVMDHSSFKTPLHPRHHKIVHKETSLSLPKAFIYIAIGLIGLVIGGEIIVEQAKSIASQLGMSDHNIGLLIVGPGTSMPELTACLVAAYKRNTDMVIGNIIGSNLFNIFFTLGITSIIAPVPLDLAMNKVVILNLGLAVFLTLVVWLSRDKQIGRVSSAAMLLAYVAYMASSL